MTIRNGAALAAALHACVLFYGLPAYSEDALIWTPSRPSENAMKLRMGVRAPGMPDVSAGAEMSVSASSAGKISNGVPVSVWGRMARSVGASAGVTANQGLDARYDPYTGVSTVRLETKRKRILTRQLDFETGRTLVMSCNPYDHGCKPASASQSARLSLPGTGTALIAEGIFSQGAGRVANRFAVEQKILGAVDLRAALDEPVRAPRGSISLRLAQNW